MKQVSFAEAEFGLKKKRTRRKKFLAVLCHDFTNDDFYPI